MTEIDKSILPEPDKNQKVEVFVKRDTEETYGELDLFRVFSNMGKKRNIYLWILLLFTLIGLAIPMLMVEMDKETGSVSAMISFRYPQAAIEKAPDNSPLNVRYISSSYILQKALNRTKLSKNITISAVEHNLSVERLLNESTRQNLEVMQKVIESSKTSDDYSQVLKFNYKYDGKYIITLANGFDKNQNSTKLIYLDGNELSALLNNIIASYNEYFFTTYKTLTLPDNNLDSIKNSELDFIERLDEVESLFNNLSKYCTDKEKSNYLTYRSKRTGLSFLDLNDCVKLLKDIAVDYLYSYAFANNITKGELSTITKYEYNLQNTEREFNSILAAIENNANLLAIYKNDSIALNTSEDGTSTVKSSVTDYYNTLITNQADNYERKAELGEQIANLNYKISGFHSNTNKSAQIAYMEEEMKDLEIICNVIYELVKDHTNEILESTFYKATYMDYIGAQYFGNSIFTSSNIKKMLIGMVVGIILAVFIWGLDGLVEEMKRSSSQEKQA